ncbi:uncharacterized protein EV422DRAFT_508693 [Fimicolochytrium jonesii]|uniref:uncharacterized protein n=1 Tax=Fimicolochytrium jonesii TaxID=1396493 RepID=UPI0022FE5367|nr:uncharacterized protein EV422DRAFT_508693 [Fimicolochytrium jonesii]KAI8817871.1 hypothetical protein EV422DRAFT_508693 [Fimicolochytrium jonesii]
MEGAMGKHAGRMDVHALDLAAKGVALQFPDWPREQRLQVFGLFGRIGRSLTTNGSAYIHAGFATSTLCDSGPAGGAMSSRLQLVLLPMPCVSVTARPHGEKGRHGVEDRSKAVAWLSPKTEKQLEEEKRYTHREKRDRVNTGKIRQRGLGSLPDWTFAPGAKDKPLDWKDSSRSRSASPVERMDASRFRHASSLRIKLFGWSVSSVPIWMVTCQIRLAYRADIDLEITYRKKFDDAYRAPLTRGCFKSSGCEKYSKSLRVAGYMRLLRGPRVLTDLFATKRSGIGSSTDRCRSGSAGGDYGLRQYMGLPRGSHLEKGLCHIGPLAQPRSSFGFATMIQRLWSETNRARRRCSRIDIPSTVDLNGRDPGKTHDGSSRSPGMDIVEHVGVNVRQWSTHTADLGRGDGELGWLTAVFPISESGEDCGNHAVTFIPFGSSSALRAQLRRYTPQRACFTGTAGRPSEKSTRPGTGEAEGAGVAEGIGEGEAEAEGDAEGTGDAEGAGDYIRRPFTVPETETETETEVEKGVEKAVVEEAEEVVQLQHTLDDAKVDRIYHLKPPFLMREDLQGDSRDHEKRLGRIENAGRTRDGRMSFDVRKGKGKGLMIFLCFGRSLCKPTGATVQYNSAHYDMLNHFYVNMFENNERRPSFLTLMHHMAIAARQPVPPKGMALVIDSLGVIPRWTTVVSEAGSGTRAVGVAHGFAAGEYNALSPDGKYFADMFRELQRRRMRQEGEGIRGGRREGRQNLDDESDGPCAIAGGNS